MLRTLLICVCSLLLFLAACGSEDPVETTDGGTVACGETQCSADQLCVITVVMGGACQPRPAEGCPEGSVATTCQTNEPGCVSRTTTLACKPKPEGCSPIACGCVATPICGDACGCTRASETDVGCMCFAP